MRHILKLHRHLNANSLPQVMQCSFADLNNLSVVKVQVLELVRGAEPRFLTDFRPADARYQPAAFHKGG